MCTVTYLPLDNDNFILTSNRDETPLRKTVPPKKYIENGVEITYPKDALAGGTWIGLSEKKRLVCLLNGGFTIHKRKSSYKMSRGIIVKNILTNNQALHYIKTFDFTDIEPFTLVFVDWTVNLATYELVWNGETKHFQKLPQEPKIWSSSTLYSNEMKELRKRWFADFLEHHKEYNQQEIVAFHKNETLGTIDISPKMKREFVETVSITSVKKIASEIDMSYIDFLEK
ncbi:NRDE family protein [Polaribacter batillariae]|uniref:NRDE family protein n=1 Tax=Polaribacter batillariae TaxID=2808900 RepID=A0ABX7SWQ1_9FLAO|nr:NRDE family protein [Polaribacter batillariae]QTD38687.1 NRDE family protein [Polaribacter batillariae]